MAQYPVKLISRTGGEELFSGERPHPQTAAKPDDRLYRLLEEQLDNEIPEIDRLLEIGKNTGK